MLIQKSSGKIKPMPLSAKGNDFTSKALSENANSSDRTDAVTL
jgi:hypothetical protein